LQPVSIPNFDTYQQSAPHCGHIPTPFFGK
jgi:hypothetical protein